MKVHYNNIQFDNGLEPTDTVYSDRLRQWDWEKYNNLCKKHFGNESDYWDKRSPESIESFLKDYLEKDITLCRIEKHENKSNGYPVWRIDYK